MSFRFRIVALELFMLISLSGVDVAYGGNVSDIQADSIFYFKGRVLDSISRQPVVFTHIINISKKRATISDTLGYFFIRVSLFDTLQLTAIGFAPLQIIINDSHRQQEKLPDILIRSVRYSILGVMINPLGSYESFKQKMIGLELPPSGFEINPSLISDIEKGTDTLDMIQTLSFSPVTALYNWLSKEGRSRRRYLNLIEQEQFEKDIAYKYNPAIIEEITGYSGFDLYRFMDFCSFNKKFLLEADIYEIQDAVLKKKAIFEALEEK
ncbi:hypothetical protein ACFLTU_00660 [Bacteroidota bacterium]